MRPLVPRSPCVRTIAVIIALAVSGCCSTGKSDGSAQKPADPAASATPEVPGPMDLSPAAAMPTTSAEAPASSATAPAAPERRVAGAAHILVAYKGSEGAPKTVTRSKEDAKKRAQEVLDKLKADNTLFDDLVAKYSDDAMTKPTRGMLGNFEPNVMPPAFSDTTFTMQVNTIADVVVETPRGFHIIKRTR